MKKLLSLLFLFSSIYVINAQKQTLPVGEYYTEMNGSAFYLTISKNDEFQISMAKGKLIETDSLVKLEPKKLDSPTFGIKYLEKNKATDSLTITFNSKMRKYQLYYIFIGMQQDEKEEVKYYSPENFLSGNYYDIDEDAIEIKIPKTKYLHFLENEEENETNNLSIFKIPDEVSKVEINYETSLSKDFNLTGEYDPVAQVITLYEQKEGRKDDPLTFYADYEKYISEFEKPFKTEENVDWDNPNVVVEDDYPYESDSTYESNTPYQFKLKTFNTIDEALKTTSAEKKVLVVINSPNNTDDTKSFDKFVKNYDIWLSNTMYDKYNRAYDPFNFYLLTDKDKKFIKKNDLKDELILAVDGNGDLLYQQNLDVEKLESFFTSQSFSANFINEIHLMKRLDNLIEAKKFNSQEAQEIFVALAEANDYISSGYDSENLIYSARDKKNIEKKNLKFYVLKSGPEKVNAAYNKLVKSHENDSNVDYEYANMIGQFLESSYTKKLYKNSDSSLNRADLEAIDYLIKFEEQLSNYQAQTEEDYMKDYSFSGLYSYTISDALGTAAKDADTETLQKIKIRIKKLGESDLEYFRFLKNYLPKEYLSEYESFYTENFGSIENIVLKLNTLYDKQKSNQSWGGFKDATAGQANSAAWLVVEEIDDPIIINQALRWSKISLEIDPNNSYYLDTYAQLVYKSGDKKEGIKIQEQAVNNVKNNIEEYGETLLEQLEDVLQRMKNDTY